MSITCGAGYIEKLTMLMTRESGNIEKQTISIGWGPGNILKVWNPGGRCPQSTLHLLFFAKGCKVATYGTSWPLWYDNPTFHDKFCVHNTWVEGGSAIPLKIRCCFRKPMASKSVGMEIRWTEFTIRNTNTNKQVKLRIRIQIRKVDNATNYSWLFC